MDPVPSTVCIPDPTINEPAPSVPGATEAEEQNASISSASPAAEPSLLPAPSMEPTSELDVADVSSSGSVPPFESTIESTIETIPVAEDEPEKDDTAIVPAPETEDALEAPTAPILLQAVPPAAALDIDEKLGGEEKVELSPEHDRPESLFLAVYIKLIPTR